MKNWMNGRQNHSALIQMMRLLDSESPLDGLTTDTQHRHNVSIYHTNFSSNKSMDNYNDYMDTMLQEIMDLPAEIYDIPEMQQDEKFDVEGYINGNTDY